jgi:peptide/nickel transport system permease protein
MLAYIVRRLLWAVFLMVVVSALVFIIFNVIPSADPAELRAGRQPSREAVEAIRHQLGLDKPKAEQFVDYMDGVFTGPLDLQRSFVNDEPVRDLVFDRFGATAFLVAGGVIVWLIIGLTVGTISAVRKGTLLDRLAMGSALVAISAPVYWLGLVVLFLFSEDIGRFPLLPGSGAYQNADGFLERCHALLMPWLVLATAFAAIYARLLRSNLLDVMGEDYIRTARAKGLHERTVVLKHGIRSAITPVVTILGIDVGVLFGGAILTETVFNIPGIGRLAFDAIERGDLMTIQGTTLILALGVALMNLLVDIAYGFLDPRVRY